jgi:hypothetical protein
MLLGGVELYLAGEAVFAGVLFAGSALSLLAIIFGGRKKH